MEPDPGADFAEFVAERSASLLRAAWLLTGDQHKAEDLLQTVLARLWLRLRNAGDVRSMDALARRMLYTTFLTWWRRRWRFEVPVWAVSAPDGVADPANDTAVRLAVRERLAQLSKRQRAVLVARFFEDRSVEATAELLGCSVGAVKTHTARALTVLRSDATLRELIH